jgi:ubiquinone/menaquinone biosynthesis C-methylase UbiE
MNTHETTFYDHHPFDWTEGYSGRELEATLAPLLAAFIQGTPSGALVLDLGCGPGRVMSCLAASRLRAVGLDLSFASVRIMMQRTGKPGVIGNGMQLPFAEGSIDRVIADGVIHHTSDPFAAFAEGCRVLKPQGLFYVAVYKPGGRYQKLYRFPGAVIRSLIKHRAGKALVHATFLPLYYLAHLLKSGGKRSWSGAKNLFYDYFATPIVEFLSHDELDQWSKRCRVEIVDYNSNPPLNVHSFLIRKRTGDAGTASIAPPEKG